MAQMRVTAFAAHFRASHEVGGIRFLFHVSRVYGFVKGRPPRAGVELGVRFEQVGPTADALIEALFVVVPVLSGKGPFRAGLAGDSKLFVG